MNSYEKQIQEKDLNVSKIDLPLLKYFWQSNPLISASKATVPRFLRDLNVLKNFGDIELYTLSKFLHQRSFEKNEIVFSQGELGVGFYFVFSGHIDIVINKENDHGSSDGNIIVSLEKGDYFGELALLQEKSTRNATAIATDNCILLGLLKPDLEMLIEAYPVTAAKFLQSTSLIIANRLFALTKEMSLLKHKMNKAEVVNE